jgi:hypothetical protein
MREQRFLLLSALMLAAVSSASAQAPQATIDNGVLHATIELPDATKGFYRGTRFDWSGVISNLTFAGHSFYGPWFTKTKPGVHDFIFDGADITAGRHSSVTGPAEEFVTANDSAVGFDQATAGKTFIKIGVGALVRPDDKAYDPYRDYEVADYGMWKVQTHRTSVEFTQRLVDEKSGYGYLYTKTLRLDPIRPVLTIEHTLKNLGRLPIETEVYDHNFLVLDHQTTGPDLSVRLPFPITPEKPIKADLGMIDGNRIVYRRPLEGRDVFTVQIGGFGSDAKDYNVTIENSRAGVGMRITGDRPLAKEELWSIRSIMAVEPFIHLSAAPGETIHWTYSYLYYRLAQAKR